MSVASALRAVREMKVEYRTMSGVASVVIAADFATGREAGFARACSAKGEVLEIIRREEDESHAAFVDRAKSATAALTAPRLVIGGLDPTFDPGALPWAPPPPPRAIALPEGTGLHPVQARMARVILDTKRVVLRAGRRFGKSALLIALAADEAMRGRPVGYFSPLFKTASPVFDALASMLDSLVVSKNRGVREIKLATGGVIDIWSIESSVIIARGRKYALALVDEVAFVKVDMGLLWRASISPTLIDLNGSAVVGSTPWGTDPTNWFYQICCDKSLEWTELHARSEDNPYLSREALAEEKRTNSPLVWRQEFEAEFVSLDSAALIDVTKLLRHDGTPWPEPERFIQVFVVVDSAIKTGSGNDGTGALFCGVTGHRPEFRRLWLLDYDIIQVTAGALEPWLLRVVERARQLHGVRTAIPGKIYVEDAATGPILIEKFPQLTEALPHQWTAEGKDVRAYSTQRYFNGGFVCMTEACYNKTVSFKGVRINHLWTQLNGFVLGDKNAAKRADDLLDCATYAASIVWRPEPIAAR